jgi:electron transport complex protein RnfA
MARDRRARDRRLSWVPMAALAWAGALAFAGAAWGAGGGLRIVSARVRAPDLVLLRLSGDLPRAEAANFRVTAALAPDVPIAVRRVEPRPGGRLMLTLAGAVSAHERYRVEVLDPPLARDVAPPIGVTLLTVFLAAALVQNFVFTRYLGLCIFFGVSKKRDTALGMGATFTAVMVLTGMLGWAIDTWVLRPLHLGFLQIVVFIGVVAFLVQMLDTVLRKTHPGLHRRFGIYLVLITTNCIILAVPLLNSTSGAGALESLGLALGSGVGFAMALFLMSSARERMELARVPTAFQGLPIAFALAGLFALAFMGFSGLDFSR